MALFPGKSMPLCNALPGTMKHPPDALTTSTSVQARRSADVPLGTGPAQNCGSPIETDAGWLVLSHGVGLRTYCIGRFSSIPRPGKVIGLREPLLKPNQESVKAMCERRLYLWRAPPQGTDYSLWNGRPCHRFRYRSLDEVLAACNKVLSNSMKTTNEWLCCRR
jgi:hypothetical protein